MATINGTNNNETLLGTNGDDTLYGLAGNDTLFGLEGNDTLDGGTGIDSLSGGLGDDQYYVDDTNDIVVELINQGKDTVLSTVTYTLSANLENLTLLGNLAINGTGNDSANLILGNSANNILVGGGGFDTIEGGSGDDSITGGGTTDKLYGQDGNDTLTGGGGSDELYGGAGNDLLSTVGAGEAIPPTLNPFVLYDSKVKTAQDLARAILAPVADGQTSNIQLINGSAKYTGADQAAAFFDKLEFGQLEGVNFSLGKGIVLTSGDAQIPSSNTSTGFGDNNGKEGDEQLTKIVNELFPGSKSFDASVLEFKFTVTDANLTQVTFDILFGSDEYPEYVGQFVDIAAVYVDGINYAFFENGKPLSVIQDNLTPGNFYNNKDRALAIEYDGMSAPLKITGNLLGAGEHTIRIAIADTKDSILDSGIFISNLQAVADTGETGVRLNNSDILDGGPGADTMKAGYGNDFYSVDNVGDVIEEDDGKGNDTVNSTINYTLSANLENLNLLETQNGDNNLTGEGNAKNNRLKGNSGNNLLVGNAGNDTLDGGLGTDTLVGGEGDDSYIIRDESDVIIESGLSTNDIVKSTVSFTLSNNLEHLILLDNALNGTGNTGNNRVTGNKLNNILTGDAGNDTLDGSEGDDTLIGGTGDDTYYIDSAKDIINELIGQGKDTVFSSISYVLAANIENITLTGDANLDATGNDINNIITGNNGKNILTGGKGNDIYIIGEGDTVIELENEGIDSIQSSVSYNLSNSHIENLSLLGKDNIDAIGNHLNNTLTGNEGNNILNGGQGVDLMIGGLGDDIYYIDSINDKITELSNQGNDTVISTISYSLANTELEHITLIGTEHLKATGSSKNNILIGNEGNNTIDGGTGNDTLTGGLGDDTYIIDNASDVIVELANQGNDTVFSQVSYSLGGTSIENLRLIGTGTLNATGNDENNLIVGNNANNDLSGGKGSDTLEAGAGNDTLRGGDGADFLLGGGGNDTYYIENQDDFIKELPLIGTDTVISTLNYTLGAYLENLTLEGSATSGDGNELDNNIVGNTNDNILNGYRGNDTLDGGVGADTLIGGIGNDTYIIDNINDVITEFDKQGIDTVQSKITYSIASLEFIENLTLLGFGDLSATGNKLNNIIKGNDAKNTLDGGEGIDTLLGGNGDDTYIVDNLNDQVIEVADNGTDTIQTNLSYILTDNIENLILTGTSHITGTGNTLSNKLIGNAHDNILNGLSGNDTLEGGAGNDSYIFTRNSGMDEIFDNLGNNTLLINNLLLSELGFSKASNNLEVSINGRSDKVIIRDWYTNNNNRMSLQLTDGTTLSATQLEEKANANTSNNGSGAGSSGNDNLTGTTGNDNLNGGEGADTMAGGSGDDIYTVDNTGDVVIENENQGTDTIKSSVNYTLSNHVEKLVLTGTGFIKGTGNTLNNYITGNSGNNILDGGSGIDTLEGGAGDDIYIVDHKDDLINEIAGEGYDTVRSFIDYTLGANIEVLSLIDALALKGTGNQLNNLINGNDANNTLTGGDGKDTLKGGLGDDTYIIQATDIADIITEKTNEGNDTIQSYATYELSENVENIILLGNNAIDAYGNSQNNTLIGNDANNTLNGRAGNDTLQGGLGNDVYVFGRGAGQDLINNTDANNGNDKVLFNTDVNYQQLWLERKDNHLVLTISAYQEIFTEETINGTTSLVAKVKLSKTNDTVTIQDWYSNSAKQVDSFELSDGKVLLASEVQQLVDKMASFGVFKDGSLTVNKNQYDADILPVLNITW